MLTKDGEEGQVAGSCETCPFRNVCREIFVLREILKDEATYLENQELRLRITEAVSFLERVQFRYPFADKHCQISEEEESERVIRKLLQGLLAEVRSVNRVSL